MHYVPKVEIWLSYMNLTDLYMQEGSCGMYIYSPFPALCSMSLHQFLLIKVFQWRDGLVLSFMKKLIGSIEKWDFGRTIACIGVSTPQYKSLFKSANYPSLLILGTPPPPLYIGFLWTPILKFFILKRKILSIQIDSINWVIQLF